MEEGLLASAPPTLLQELRWRMRAIPQRLREWAIRWMVRAIVRLTNDSNLVAHARRELRTSLAQPETEPGRWMADGLLELLAVFANQGHSGFSAPCCVDWFDKLARFQPLGPLTGEPDEWFDHGDGTFQNIRCGRVFKQPDRFGGQAYDIQGRVFREPNGACFTRGGMDGGSCVPITFPYTPTTEYVDVPASD